ncbi:Phytosulfokine [Hibiscus syriacus]|uniref:Phytosulfokine n=1 Tax=Hibiscus syriacus TaxID=106335 RepID=A0A6A2ZSQ6_HIBSY|nr:phytosulfokines 3-like [Hibiscus syriacus]KAE8695081.1 Phytosulfokine [Hibiscus syriacus]
MGEFTTLSFLTLLISTLSFAARTVPNESVAKTQPQAFIETEQSTEAFEVEDRCEGIAEDDCLMRRTLSAHLDCIYTQNHKP